MTDKELYCLVDWIVFRTGTSIGGWFLCVKIISFDNFFNILLFLDELQELPDFYLVFE